MISRAYHIAFEKRLDPRLLMEIARRSGIGLKTHMGALDAETETKLREAVDEYGRQPLPPPEAPAPAAPPAAADPSAPPPAAVSQPPGEDALDFSHSASAGLHDVASTPAAPGAPAATLAERAAELAKAKPKPEVKPLEIQPVDDKKAGAKKKKRIKEEIKPLDREEILEELKGRFISTAMKDVLEPGKRAGRVRPTRLRRTVRPAGRRASGPSPSPTVSYDQEIEVPLPVTLKDLSRVLGVKASLMAKKLIDAGNLVKMNDPLGADLVEILALEFGRTVKVVKAPEAEEIATRTAQIVEKQENLVLRSPVVAFLGHVDHGKTSLLDAIRKTNVAAGEAGGITQHMAASRVTFGEKTIVFLDTPGHKAFTDMRARGAQVTDIVVLVVAADDGVMPQTEEAISHARAAEVPIIVAMNKVDKPDSKPERVMQQLAAKGLNWDKWGGDTVIVKTSAITKEGIPELIEMINLVAEMEDLKADPTVPARGTILEAVRSEGRGVVATLLLTAGTLRRGDVILAGKTFGHVRALYDDKARPVEEGLPSMPLQVTGLSDLPEAGDQILVLPDEASARQVAEERARRDRVTTVREQVTLENLFARIEAGRINEVPFILKVDAQGSLIAMQEQMLGLSTPEVKVQILHSGVGGINESDVLLALASNAIIVGFHVVPTERARILAQEKGVDIRLFNIIYQVLDDIRAALEGTLEPDKVEAVKAHVEIRQVFRIPRVGAIAGCFVKDGTIERSHYVRLIRDDVVVYDNAKLESLKRFKEDVREVGEGFECGLRVAGYDDYKVGDVVESYVVNLVPRKLSEPVRS